MWYLISNSSCIPVVNLWSLLLPVIIHLATCNYKSGVKLMCNNDQLLSCCPVVDLELTIGTAERLWV